jgi:predicted bacteriocin transport accessory protein
MVTNKNKILLLSILILSIFCITGCKKNEDLRKDEVKFKEEYESLNKTTAKDGNLYRTITISEKNPIVYTSTDELIESINKKESFIVFFGDSTSSWCRSVTPYMIDQANTQGIDKIYYISLEQKEDKEGVKALDGDISFQQIKETLSKDKIDTPTLAVYINGQATRATSGISSKQTDANQELSGDMIRETKDMFKQIYSIYNSNRK